MKVVPYLNFDGRCAEAFRFYERLFDGKLELMTFGDSPMGGEMAPDWKDRVMHAYLAAGDLVLMGSDAPGEHFQKPQGLYVSLHADDAAQGERIFAALAEGGSVTMPFERTFWAERFGMLTDRFGTPWMVNVAPVPEPSSQGS
jgi:PhnB protein